MSGGGSRCRIAAILLAGSDDGAASRSAAGGSVATVAIRRACRGARDGGAISARSGARDAERSDGSTTGDAAIGTASPSAPCAGAPSIGARREGWGDAIGWEAGGSRPCPEPGRHAPTAPDPASTADASTADASTADASNTHARVGERSFVLRVGGRSPISVLRASFAAALASTAMSGSVPQRLAGAGETMCSRIHRAASSARTKPPRSASSSRARAITASEGARSAGSRTRHAAISRASCLRDPERICVEERDLLALRSASCDSRRPRHRRAACPGTPATRRRRTPTRRGSATQARRSARAARARDPDLPP